MDLAFTDGTIAVKERYLLKDKLLRMCEANAEDAFRMLKDGGFGAGAVASSVGEYEKLIAADEADIDAFIREFAPTNAEKEYLLSPRDFHNVKAFIKAKYLGKDPEAMLAPEGLIPVESIKEAVSSGDYSPFGQELTKAAADAESYLWGEEPAKKDGAVVGGIFVKAEFSHLKKACSRNPVLKALIAAQVDMTNLLTAYRWGGNPPQGELVCGGNLGEGELIKALNGEECGQAYAQFIKSLTSPKGVSAAENYKDSYPLKFLAENKYELKAGQPFLYYILRRRAENADVRIIFACLLNGVAEREIKARLRGERAAL